jgi:CRISPR-associated protein Csm1
MTPDHPPYNPSNDSSIALAAQVILRDLEAAIQSACSPEGIELEATRRSTRISELIQPLDSVGIQILQQVEQMTAAPQPSASCPSGSRGSSGLPPILAELDWPNPSQSQSQFFLPLRPLSFSPEDFFPQVASSQRQTATEYEKLLRLVASHIRPPQGASSWSWLEELLAVLERYLLSTPAPKVFPHECLYDRCRVRAAFTVCLATQYRDESKIDSGRFRLVGLSLGHIQRFLLHTPVAADMPPGESPEKGMAKQLRAKSFYVGLLSWLSGQRILDDLGLPSVCRLFDAGGRTILLVPDTEQTVKRLDDVIARIECWFRNELAGTIRCDIAVSPSIEQERLSQSQFQKTFREFDLRLINARHRQPFPELVQDSVWQLDGWVDEQETLPADSSRFQQRIRRLGDRLVKCHYLTIENSEEEPDSESDLLTLLGYSISFSEQAPQFGRTFALSYHESDPATRPVYLWPQYVPKATPERIAILNRLGLGQGEDSETLRSDIGELLTFVELASLSTDDDGIPVTHGMLGAVKADVDHLGTLLSYGLGQTATLPRLSTLARSLNLFFKGFLNHQLSHRFPCVYTVFSGGDDLFLIGPWYDLVRFLLEFRNWFQRATAQNPNVTFSAGLIFADPKVPVRSLGYRADEAIDHAKEAGRNRICVGSTVVTWDQYEQAIELHRLLRRLWAPSSPSPLNRSLLYRLLKYAEMARSTQSGMAPHPADLKWRAQMSYDLKRNLPLPERHPQREDLVQLHTKLLEIRTFEHAQVLFLAAMITIYSIRGERT